MEAETPLCSICVAAVQERDRAWEILNWIWAHPRFRELPGDIRYRLETEFDIIGPPPCVVAAREP